MVTYVTGPPLSKDHLAPRISHLTKTITDCKKELNEGANTTLGTVFLACGPSPSPARCSTRKKDHRKLLHGSL